jgi:hypothetical protein
MGAAEAATSAARATLGDIAEKGAAMVLQDRRR